MQFLCSLSLYCKIPVLILFLSCFSGKVWGQKELDTIIDSKLHFYVPLLSIIDPYTGTTAMIGIEKKIKANKTLYMEGGYILPRSLLQSYAFRNNKGVWLKLEPKLYLNKDGIADYDCVSFSVWYKYQSYGITDTINLKPAYRNDYEVSKNVFGMMVYYGGKQSFRKTKFTMGMSFGLGVRVKFAHSTLSGEENENILGVGDSNTNLFTHRAGHFVYPDFGINLYAGYRLK